MAVPIRWLKQAEHELDEIWRFVAEDSPQNASAIIVRLVKAARDLGDDPRIGHVVPEFNQIEIREYAVWPFRLVYRVDESGIVILAIVHGAREMPAEVVKRMP